MWSAALPSPPILPTCWSLPSSSGKGTTTSSTCGAIGSQTRRGLLAAAIYGPHTVGIAKVTLISAGQWWLEGFRVDPNYQGLKIGSHLHEYLGRWWLEHGNGTLRLMTSSERVQVQHLSARTGFSKVGEVWAYTARALEGPPNCFEPVGAQDVADAVRFASTHLAGPHRLLDLGWRFAAPDTETLTRLMCDQRLYWWGGRRGLAGFWEDDDEAGRVLAISFVACAPGQLTSLLAAIPGLAKQNEYVSVLWLAPNDKQFQAEMTSAGFASEWDHAGFLYEKKHPRI
jgi:GNAT superfamily N-acetyltransferase